jgi:predicted site-specific integrase-resolvase
MFVSIGEASTLIGVAVSTLRRWEKEARLHPSFRTKGNHRRYSINEIQESFLLQSSSKKTRQNICYARVSSHDQKEDLERQKQRLELYCENIGVNFEVISDLGSGLNYNKKGLNTLINKICSSAVDTLFLTHKDRLLRFGSPLLFKLCNFFGTKVVILDETKVKNFEEELVGDVIELMTVFCSKIYGRRSHSNRKKAA